MISKIQFPEVGNGYIYEKIKKPEEPSNPSDRFGIDHRQYINCKTDKERNDLYNKLITEYNKELEYYNEHKEDYVLKCSELLIGKTFNFEPHKINVVFGPNGCGKTTILKAIAGNALITDGWTRLMEPFDMSVAFERVCYADILPQKIEKRKLNTCNIDWDGVPIYFENFAHTELSSHHMFGDLSGSIFNDISEEASYQMLKGKINLGGKSALIINKVLNICEKPMTYNDILDPYIKKMRYSNDTWVECFKCQIDYFNNLPKANSGEPNTILFDEIDKSLDIENVLYLYTELLPKFAEKYGVQFILVSHSPVILSDKVFNDKRYNIISMDKEYTMRCRNLLK